METNLAIAASQDPTIAIVEPVTPPRLEAFLGADARSRLRPWASAHGSPTAFWSTVIFSTCCVGFAPESSWSDNQGAFEDFFKSFKPATTKM